MSLRPKLITAGRLSAARSLARLLAAAGAVLATLVIAPIAAGAQSGGISIEKSTNGSDADTAPGPILAPGSAVTWSYAISVTGTTTLYDIIVSDSSGIVPNCDIDGDGNFDGTHIHPGPLDGGQSFSCTATGTVHGAGNGTFAASGTVKAFDFTGTGQFVDQDLSHYTPVVPFDAKPKVTIESLLNGSDADSSPGPYVAEGSQIVWTYVVTNTGNVPLTSILVGNSTGLPVDCGFGGSLLAGPMAPGASVTCTGSSPAAPSTTGLRTASGTVTATPVDPTNGASLGRINAADGLNYTPVKLPAVLAFTGPSHSYAIAGVLLALVGGGLWLAGSVVARSAAGQPATDG